MITAMKTVRLFDYRPYWAECFGTAPFLPTSREEMDILGWDSCDVILVTGDAYVDHPSFGMAVIGRTLEAQGFRVGLICQPDWRNTDDFMKLGEPNLYYGVTAGNMDSLINHYTADKKIRKDDAYTPGNKHGARPDRAVIVYSQRCREAYKHIPIVIGGIEASLRRIAHYDYWSDRVRRSVLVDSRADILLYGNAERALVELTHRVSRGESIQQIRDIRGTAYVCKKLPEDIRVTCSTTVDKPGLVEKQISPYQMLSDKELNAPENPLTQPDTQVVSIVDPSAKKDTRSEAIEIPSHEAVVDDPVLYAHASRVLHKETNPGNARTLIQKHADRYLVLNPPPIPLSTEEMDWIFERPYQRVPHPSYGDARIPAYEMIRFSINIMRGCFGGCTFCSITEHEGRIIQNRSEDSILREIEAIRDKTPGFTGTISDLGGPTANMWRLHCKDPKIEQSCRRLSCVYPGICKNLKTDQTPLIQLYRKARGIEGVKRVLIASGLRYDIAVETPEYVEELVTHHVGGYLKIAPEHTEQGPLSKMMKPGIGTYDRFKAMFEKYSKKAGKEQYLIPYFIAAHPGTEDEDMLNLALWLKDNGFKADQVQTFYPSPMASATAMYHTGRNPLKRVDRKSELINTVKEHKVRRLHKAYLRYHAEDSWPLIRESLEQMGRTDLIGNKKGQLVPPERGVRYFKDRHSGKITKFRTQHARSERNDRDFADPKPTFKAKSKSSERPVASRNRRNKTKR